MRNDTVATGGLTFEPNGIYLGHAVCYADSAFLRSSDLHGASITLGKRSRFGGCLITDGTLELREVEVTGRIWARTLLTMQERVPYKNWLFGCSLRPEPVEAPFPLLGSTPVALEVVRW
jgi:hypothetical protein